MALLSSEPRSHGGLVCRSLSILMLGIIAHYSTRRATAHQSNLKRFMPFQEQKLHQHPDETSYSGTYRLFFQCRVLCLRHHRRKHGPGGATCPSLGSETRPPPHVAASQRFSIITPLVAVSGFTGQPSAGLYAPLSRIDSARPPLALPMPRDVGGESSSKCLMSR